MGSIVAYFVPFPWNERFLLLPESGKKKKEKIPSARCA